MDKLSTSITLSNLSVFRYPDGKQRMAVVSFDQDFKSDRLDNRMRKRQYWKMGNGNPL